MYKYEKPKQKQTQTYKNAVQKKETKSTISSPNITGIPDSMKTHFENISGLSFDDVRVHYNSDKPKLLQALAYTQGNQVYIGPGQKKHLGHELGHVVQQKLGMVNAKEKINGISVNRDSHMESQADDTAFLSSTARMIDTPVNGAPVLQMQGPHPLQASRNELTVEAYEEYKKRHEGIGPVLSMADFLHEKDDLSKVIMKEYLEQRVIKNREKRESGHVGGDKETDLNRAQTDLMLMKSIAALSTLHQSGAIFNFEEMTADERCLYDIAYEPYRRRQPTPGEPETGSELGEIYGMDTQEQMSLASYSSAGKMEETNPDYMGDHSKWGDYKDGWTALNSAMRKIPSLGELGITATTYRVLRKEGTEQPLNKLDTVMPGTVVRHGFEKMPTGQKHLMSTSITYSCHMSEKKVDESGGVIAMTGHSGRLINPFGYQGLVDGGEVLYPPEFCSVYEEKEDVGFDSKGSSREGAGIVKPVYHMREQAPPLFPGRVISDKDFQDDIKYEMDSLRREIGTFNHSEVLRVCGQLGIELSTANVDALRLIAKKMR